ncbi:unnamed protein product [Lactuca saligna]|uniref:Pentacotripeptide-repeat region of PRORP domain-containing protein n=1 Tax=Lactuca saligna TaxID=75948 RepID=A0AA35V441_LACSI|nr:unnamed protein product [Lactuca saligna]
MCTRVSIKKLFAPSFRKSSATEFGRKEILKEWRLGITVIKETKAEGYPVNPTSVQKQIMNALHLGERERASSLLSHIGYNNHLLKPNNFLKILEYCASIPDPPFVLEIWKTMEEKGVDINNECHILMIQALCKGGYIEEAFNLMSNFEESPDLYPSLNKYNTILEASAKLKSATHASKCLDLMEHDMVGKNETTYTELLKLAVLQKNLPYVHNIWKEYAKYYNFNFISLREFIWAFTRLGDVGSACEALRHLVDLVFRGGFSIKENAEGNLVISRLDVPIPFYSNLEWDRCQTLNNITSVPSIYENNNKDHIKIGGFDLKEVKHVGRNSNIGLVMRILRLSFADVIQACAREKNHELAEQLFVQMQNLGIKPSRGAYDGLIRVLLQEKGFHDGMKVVKLMQERNMKPLDSTLASLSARCSKDLELNLAESFLSEMSQCTTAYPYNQLLGACGTLDEPERGIQVFGKMKKLKVAPNITTYELLFSLFGNVNAPYEDGNNESRAEAAKRINAIENDMIRNGIQHSYVSIRNLLKALGSEGMISEIEHYLHVAENQLTTPGAPIYNIVLHSLVEAKEGQKAINEFKTLMSHGYHPNDVTYNIMIDCCTITGSLKSAQAFIAMMYHHGYPPQTQTYTSLIKLVLELGDFDEALVLLNQACSEGIELDALLFNTILRVANWKDRIDIIEYVMDRMHQERVPPDPDTCAHVFSAYVNRDCFTTAMEALQVMSINMLPQQDIHKYKTIFEQDFIYAEDSEADLRALNLFKDSNEIHAVALFNLRWCAMAGNQISWLTGQSHWVQQLAATNRSST